jgi:hypothetical protein
MPVVIGAPAGQSQAQLNDWFKRALRELERVSYEDAARVADDFTILGTLTESRSIDVGTATTTEIHNFLLTFISDLKKRGKNK